MPVGRGKDSIEGGGVLRVLCCGILKWNSVGKRQVDMLYKKTYLNLRNVCTKRLKLYFHFNVNVVIRNSSLI